MNSTEKYDGRQDWNWLREHATELAETSPFHIVAVHNGELVYIAAPDEDPARMHDLLFKEQGRSRSEVLLVILAWFNPELWSDPVGIHSFCQ